MQTELQQLQMFGTTKSIIAEQVAQTLKFNRDTKMLILGLLSDIQDTTNDLQFQQKINIVKYLIDTTLKGQ